MTDVFLFLLNLGISACPLIIAVIVLRRLLVKAPKYIRLILWAMVGIRLLCPLTVQSIFSLSLPFDAVSGGYIASLSDNSAENTVSISAAENSGGYYAPAYAEQAVSSPPPSDNIYPDTASDETESAPVSPAPARQKSGVIAVLSYVWVAGLTLMAGHGAWSYIALKKRTAASIRLRDNIFICDGVVSPFVLGLAEPRVIIPSGVTIGSGRQLDLIVSHEKAHIAGGDHILKLLAYALLAVYWFHPLAWASYALFCRDIEYACDERVVKAMDMSDKREYSRTLLEYSVSQRSMAVCPVAFGEVAVKDRVRSVLSYKKPALWIICAALVMCVTAGVCFMTSPVNKTLDSETDAYLRQVILERGGGSGLTSENSVPFEDHIILRADKKGDVTTVYALVWYGEYGINDNGEIEEVSGWHVPAVITLDMGGSGYSSDYSEPRDGSFYIEDIKAMFPFYLRDKAINIHRYSDEQDGRCMDKARRYFMTADIAGMNIGAEMPRIIYADGHIVIMTGTFGMLVYDMDKREIRDRLSHERLHALGLDQLKAYITAKADNKGEKVLLGRSDLDTGAFDYLYVYNVSDGSLEKQAGLNEEAGSMTAFDALHSPLSSRYDDWKGFDEFIGEMNNGYLIGFEAADIGDSFIFTRAEPEWNMSTLQIVRKYYGKDKKDVYDVFPDVPKQSAAIYTPITEDCSFDAAAVDFNGGGLDTMLKAGAREPSARDSARSLPVLKISGEDELDAFRKVVKDVGVMSLDTDFIDGKSFEDTASRYTAEFFAGNDLLLIYAPANTAGTFFELESVGRDGNILSVAIAENDMYSAADDTFVGWLLAVSVPKDGTRGAESFEAYIG